MDAIDFSQQSEDYRRIEKAIRFLEDNFRSQPTLDQIAQSVHLSKYHFDRLFKRWAGISPIQFQQFLTLDYAKQKLADSISLFDVAFDAGFSGPSRLHDLFVTFEAMTPGEYKKMGAGLKIAYGFDFTPFGPCLLAVANAIAVNPLGYLIPCHRVIAKSGKIHHYRWGTLRKKAIIGWEASHYQPMSG